MSGYGQVFANGIIGGIGGAATAAYKTAVEDQKLETERIREERLSKLRMQEYAARADQDIANIPRRGAAETDVAVKAEEAKRPGLIDSRRAIAEVDTEVAQTRDRNKRDMDDEYADSDRAKKVEDEKAVGQVRQGFRMAEIGAQGDSQIRVAHASAAEARKNKWVVDAEGFYVDGDGDRVTRSEKVEGRTVTVQVKAPPSKVDGVAKGDPNWFAREELDSINRRIEVLTKSDLPDEGKLAKLLEEKNRLLVQLGKPAAATPSNDPLGIRKPK